MAQVVQAVLILVIGMIVLSVIQYTFLLKLADAMVSKSKPESQDEEIDNLIDELIGLNKRLNSVESTITSPTWNRTIVKIPKDEIDE